MPQLFLRFLSRIFWSRWILVGLFFWAVDSKAADVPAKQPDAPGVYKKVKRAVTGDTLELESGKRIRYASLEAPDPEARDKRIQRMGLESLAFNQKLADGKEIRVEWGSRLKDENGVYNPYVFTREGEFLNEEVLKAGYAKLQIQPPNLQYAERLRDVARDAREEGLGLWAHEDPSKRKSGVIGDQMTKKYYYPDDSELYDIPKGHQVEFTSSVNAKAAGYKPSEEYRRRYEQETALF